MTLSDSASASTQALGGAGDSSVPANTAPGGRTGISSPASTPATSHPADQPPALAGAFPGNVQTRYEYYEVLQREDDSL